MIEMRNITKRFGSLVANDHISFKALPGEIHALLGENGAGKTTLMSILFGLYEPDEGEILINGEVVKIKDPNDATKYNIGMVHQHFKLVEVFTVLDNIILGLEDLKYGFITKDKARQKITEIMNQYNLHVDLDEYVKNLTVGEQQKVEILKMLYRNSDILIFDEPTAVLTPQEIDELIEIMKGFAKEGKTVILITHKLEEIKRAANKCTILRRGKVIDTVDVKSVTKNQLAEMMVGRVLNQKYEFNEYQPKEKVLSLKNVTLKGKSKDILKDISFDVHKGEILGIAGIDGNGQTELVQVITGMMRHTSGEIILNNEYAKDLVQKYDIRSAAGINSSARSMSGGNQQKAIVAREIEKPHDLLIAFQPTRGLDVGAINNIHQQMIKERNNDKAVLLVSFELEEIFSLSDRILVIFEGQIVGEFLRGQVDEETIGLYMSGTRKEVE